MEKQSIKEIIGKFKFPTRKEINKAIGTFQKKDWIVLGSLLLVMIFSVIILLGKINKEIATVVPTDGGSITEGIIGTPRFANPVLAISGPDKDLTNLIYSGLMRRTNDGALIPDLAESYEISENGLSYTFTLRENASFHDGTQVTADDIVFTIEMIQDPLLKSPERVNWEGVSAEQVDRNTVKFTLRQPYVSFLDNTTVGVLPSHIWANIPIEQFTFSDFNLNAIGSGPYKVTSIKKKNSGVIENFELKAFRNFTLGKPFIDSLSLYFYSNEASLIRAVESGQVRAAHALTPSYVSENYKQGDDTLYTTPLSRTFTLFFNKEENPIFQDSRVVEALELAIDKETIIHLVLSDFGGAIDHPIPKTIAEFQTLEARSPEKPFKERQMEAEALLDRVGWKKGDDGFRRKGNSELAFSLSTGNAFELQQTAEILREYFELIGVRVDLKVFEIGNLNQNIIRPRNFEALFFGQIISKEADLYAFWHSSQREDPGLNIAGYANKDVDDTLEELLQEKPTPERFKLYANLKKEMADDTPALFIYSPDFIYIKPKNVKNISYKAITSGEDRFDMIHTWYIQTDTVWNIFLPKDFTITN